MIEIAEREPLNYVVYAFAFVRAHWRPINARGRGGDLALGSSGRCDEREIQWKQCAD
jgi:hypothetical protein